MSVEKPIVSVIIISYNTRAMTLDCLRALYSDLKSIPAEVWVVDNASQDDSVAAIRRVFPKVLLIANQDNKGFGAANNQALAQAQGEFLLLLNSDAFPKPEAVKTLIEYLKQHPRVAVVGPRLLNRDGSLQRSCYPFPSPSRAWLENLWISAVLPNHHLLGDYSQWPHDNERIVDFVSGACMMVRRTAYEQVGGFDERFFMYSEETDWQRRMTKRGWKVAFTPAAQVTHLGGASGAAEMENINAHFFDSLDFYERKHHGLSGLVSLRMAMIVGCLLRFLLWSLVGLGVPTRRPAARAKTRLLYWLLIRQATYWPLKSIAKNAA